MGLFSGITNTLFGKPPTFDAAGAIAEQGRQNRVNTTNPYGSSIWSQDDDGRWTLNTSFSPELQNLFTRQISGAGNLEAPIIGDFTPGDYRDLAGSLEQATYDRGYNLLQPNFERRNRSLEQSLANKGLPIGSEAYADAMSLERQLQDKALEDLALSAVGAGRQEAGRLYGQDLTTYGANLQGDTSGFNMASTADQQRFAQLAQLLASLQPAPISPIDATGPLSAQYQAAANARNADIGLFGDILGAAATTAVPFINPKASTTNYYYGGY